MEQEMKSSDFIKSVMETMKIDSQTQKQLLETKDKAVNYLAQKVEEAKVKVQPVPTNDNVNHPAHYNYGKIEVIDYIMDKDFDYLIGNAVKYISRAGHKQDEIEDLKKAVWYINKKIQKLEEAAKK